MAKERIVWSSLPRDLRISQEENDAIIKKLKGYGYYYTKVYERRELTYRKNKRLILQ